MTALVLCAWGLSCSRSTSNARLIPETAAASASTGRTTTPLFVSAPSTASKASKAPVAVVDAPINTTAAAAPVDAGARAQDSTTRGEITEAEASRALALAHGTQLRLANWSARPGSAVALTFRSISAEGRPKDLQATLALLEKTGQGVRVVATGQLNPELASDDHCDRMHTPEDPPTVALDLAPFKLTPSETAIGLRLKCEFEAPASEGTGVHLFLFRQQESALVPIFAEAVEANFYDRVAWENIVSHVVVLMQTTTSHGLFDIVLRDNITFEPASEEKHARKRVDTTRFLFNGKRYERH